MTTVVKGQISDTAIRVSRRRSRVHTLALAIADVLALALAVVVGELAAFYLNVRPEAIPWEASVALPFLLLPVWIALFAIGRLYESDRVRIGTSSFDEIRTVALVLFAGGFVLIAALDILASGVGVAPGGRVGPVVTMIVAGAALVPLARGAVRSWILPGLAPRSRAIVVGSGQVASLVHSKLASHPELGTDVIGFVDGEQSAVPGPVLGGRDEIAAIIKRHNVDRVIIAFSGAGHAEILDVLRSLRRPEVQVSIVPRYFEGFTSHAFLDDLAGLPLVTLPPLRLGTAERTLKRAFDFALSSCMLVLLSPLLLGVAIAIKFDSRGPMLFWQKRRGHHGSEFWIAKFRTMHIGSESRRSDVRHLNEVDGPLFKVKGHDPRVTRVGSFLRRTSLDELPQLWNVLRGEMSLVGPRPFVVYEADEITGWAARRLEAKPGITGLWQILGRNDIPFDEMIRLDYLYVTNWSLWWDLKILMNTVPIVIGRRGAY